MKSAPVAHTPEIAKKSWLKEAFPVPRLLLPSPVSIDVSDGILRYIEFSRSRGDLRPKAFGTRPFPRFHAGEGDEKAREEAVKALQAWSVETGHKSVHGIIHEDETYAFKLTLPIARRSGIREAIESLLEENVPIPPSETVFEYDILKEDSKIKETQVAVAAISEKSLREYLEIFSEAGLSLISLETESRAAAKALFPKGDAGVHAVLSISPRHSVAFVVMRGAVVFSSSIPVGSIDLDRAIAKTLGVTEGEAAKLKAEKAGGEHEESAKLFEAMLPVLSTIRDELGKVLVYWKTQGRKERDFKDIEDICLIGKDSVVAGFARYISVTSRLPARQGDVWTNVLSAELSLPDLHRDDSLDYAALIGTLI
ncbi:MAG: pilus assembly protein PilM [Candidatus Taylorbacteria bacterium]|nr:pilus assembly protein PilM [Candidatus Taylorbacteria bacterium]